jgi:hypothetical protein
MNSIDERKSQIKSWIIECFHLPKSCGIEVVEKIVADKGHNTKQTTLHIKYRKKKEFHFTIQKPQNSISKEDILKLSKEIEAPIFRRFPTVGHLFRFFGMWFAVSSIYAMSSVCPFCGQAGCAVGAGSVGLIGGFFALFTLNWKTFIREVFDKLRNKASS